MKKHIFNTIFGLSSITAFTQQDQHLSQWFASPVMINPACAGSSQETMRFYSAFRTQWFTATSTAYRTIAASYDVKLTPSRLNTGNFGVGLTFFNDAQGANRLSTNALSVPLNYAIELNRISKLIVGIKAGMLQQSIKSSDLTWGNQWETEGFNQSIASNENFLPSITRFDAGAGIYFVTQPYDTRTYFIGAAGDHLTKQSVNFTNSADKLYRRVNVHGGAEIKIPRQKMAYTPQFYASVQGPNYSIIAGSDFKFWLTEGSRRTINVDEITFNMGAYYRWKDALIVNGAFNYKAISVGASYDVNVSGLRTGTKTVGAVEIFVRYKLNLVGNNYIR
jgi:type IX secretion system PorP/SprF family membrane protein